MQEEKLDITEKVVEKPETTSTTYKVIDPANVNDLNEKTSDS